MNLFWAFLVFFLLVCGIYGVTYAQLGGDPETFTYADMVVAGVTVAASLVVFLWALAREDPDE